MRDQVVPWVKITALVGLMGHLLSLNYTLVPWQQTIISLSIGMIL